MSDGKRESEKASKDVKRITDFVPAPPEGETFTPLADIVGKDVEVGKMDKQLSRNGALNAIVITCSIKGKTYLVKITQRSIVNTLVHAMGKEPFMIKIEKGKKYYSVS